MGLGHPHPHLLHGHHGALQRVLQDQAEQRDVAGGGQHRGRHLPGGHRVELPHHVRGAGRRGHLRPQADPDELLEDLVRDRPAVLSAVRRDQRLRERGRGECGGGSVCLRGTRNYLLITFQILHADHLHVPDSSNVTISSVFLCLTWS